MENKEKAKVCINCKHMQEEYPNTSCWHQWCGIDFHYVMASIETCKYYESK